jgi:menaquinone-dependent protoporphyrinogen oxidase
MSVLVAYASKHGSTEEIARFVTDRLRERGIDADAAPVQEVSDLSGVEAVVLGSAIYLGSWRATSVTGTRSARGRMASPPNSHDGCRNRTGSGGAYFH